MAFRFSTAESTLISGVFNFYNWATYSIANKVNYPNVTKVSDVCYSDSDPDLLRCDLYYAQDSKVYEKYPVLLHIHGGGWLIGDKKHSEGYSMQIADSGFFVMNVNFGLAPQHHFPAQTRSHFEAMKWLEENAEKYHLDLNNVFVSGESSGGHHAAVVCACDCNPEYAETLGVYPTKIKLKGALLYHGTYDAHLYDMLPVGRSMLQEYLGEKKVKTAEFSDYVTPMPYMNKDLTRCLVVSGTTDILTAPATSRLVKRLDELGVDYERYHGSFLPNSFHVFFLLSNTKEGKKCVQAAIKFLHETVAMEPKTEKTGSPTMQTVSA